MGKTRFQIAKKDIISFFDNLPSPILTYSSISKILSQQREFWRLPINLSARAFIDLLLGIKLKKHNFNFPHRKVIKYSWGETSIYNIFLALAENSYFTHYTAMYLHNLTDQIPKTIYVNFEQSLKKRSKKASLVQGRIDFAFSRPQRETNNIAKYGNYNVCLLNGQFTDKAGVVEISTDEGRNLSVTNIERTLIDITVRPSYSGGVYETLNAFVRAKNRVSINKLTAILKNLDFIYPYHQAIGFYLERAGVYKKEQLDLLKNFDIKYNFYLTRQIKEKAFSDTWKIYYPKELDS